MKKKCTIFCFFLAARLMAQLTPGNIMDGAPMISINFLKDSKEGVNASSILKQSPEYAVLIKQRDEYKIQLRKKSLECGLLGNDASKQKDVCVQELQHITHLHDSLDQLTQKFSRIIANISAHFQATKMYSDELMEARSFFSQGQIKKSIEALITKEIFINAEAMLHYTSKNKLPDSTLMYLMAPYVDNFFFKAMLTQANFDLEGQADSVYSYFKQAFRYGESFYPVSECAGFLVKQQKYDDAIFYYTKALSLGLTSSDSALTLNNLAESYFGAGKAAEGRAALKQSLIYFKILAQENSFFESFFVETQINLSTACALEKDFEEGEKLLFEILDFQKTAKSNIKSDKEIATTLDHLSSFYNQWLDSLNENASKALIAEKRSVLYEKYPVSYSKKGAVIERHANALGSFAWYALFARRFDEAEAAASKGLAMAPSAEWINTNLAHALLFQGKYKKAKAVYSSYKDKLIDGEPFKSICLTDLAELEKSGITHSDVKKIRKLLEDGQ